MNSGYEGGIMQPEQAQLFSVHAEIIRLIQTANGQSACYATHVSGECGKRECVWRDDCFGEARELFPSLRVRKPDAAKSFGASGEISRLPQTDDGQDTCVAKPANGKHKKWECPLRSTCKMPQEYCNIGRCEDWFF